MFKQTYVKSFMKKKVSFEKSSWCLKKNLRGLSVVLKFLFSLWIIKNSIYTNKRHQIEMVIKNYNKRCFNLNKAF